MGILFQHSSELAIRALLFLAQQAPGKLSPVHVIAADAGVSGAYLAKITQRLASAGLVRSVRGPGKGLELGRAPEAITLASVIQAVQGSVDSDGCILGAGLCSVEHPCGLHQQWLPLRNAIHEMLEKTTLADLVASLREPVTDSADGKTSVVPIDLGGNSEKRRQR